ncbi:MAG: hypothetical protein ACYTAN_06875 [Planctomycetota bacterium]|jgi:hypothetical protein
MAKHVLTDKEIEDKAADLLNYLIAKYSYGRPRNIDRLRKAFNEKALAWVKAQTARNGRERRSERSRS